MVLNRIGDLLKNREIECLVYFALSDMAWKYGRLDQNIRQHALNLIEEGGDIFVWERDAPVEVPGRKRALAALKKRLMSEQPPRKELKVVKQAPKKVRTTAEVGTVFLLPLSSKLHAALVLIGYQELEKSIEPNFVALDWHGYGLPEEKLLNDVASNVILFKSGLGPKMQVGVLPADGRKNPIDSLIMTSTQVSRAFSFIPFDTVYLSLGQIVKEINTRFAILDDLNSVM
ncbi:hypothetical protein ACFQUU_20265 [Herbaspirillum sp. GCM10030257]|uniref:hypothetical protein n=1 Tax=Herbaspirillum sp. GCM10030257 TaxID=3273393 RepID=UPI003610C6F3